MKKVNRNVPAALRRAQIDDLTLKDIVESIEFRRLLENSINALLRSHNRTRTTRFDVFYDPYDPMTACTDDYTCHLNGANPMFTQKAGEEDPIPVKQSCIRMNGASFHEGGHILYTCFSELRRMVEIFRRGDLESNVEAAFEEDYKELKEVMKNEKAAVLQGCSSIVPVRDFIASIYASLSNIVEDGRIEQLLLQNDHRFSGLTSGLIELRKYHQEIGNTWDMSQQNIPTFMNLCLLYAKYHSVGTYTGGFEAFDKATPIIDEMLETHEAKKFSQLNQKLMLCVWPLIREMIIEASEDEGSSDGQSTSGQSSQSGQQGQNGSGNQKDQNDGSEGSGTSKSLEETMKEILDEIEKTCPNENSSQNDEGESSEKSEVGTSEAPENDPSSETLDSTIGQIMSSIADEKAREKAVKEAREETKKNVMAGKGFAPYHGTRVLNMTPTSWTTELPQATEAAIKKAAREIQRHLETDMRTGTSKRKFSGKKFHAEKLVNNDFRYFENKATRKDMPKVKVGLVIDESGSMSRNGRYATARAAAITLYKIFEYIPNLDIAIYGHSTRGEVEIYDYAEFGIKQSNIIGRLNNINARSGNIDIVPVTAMAENLLKQDADTRIMFIITDGLPYSYVKNMTPEQELYEAANNYSRKGIEIIVASIGDDEELLRNIYRNQRFLNISEPTDLPKKIVNVIKRKL